ncbi:MAG: TonB-dependent receptor, partial [Parafilimonas sp.]
VTGVPKIIDVSELDVNTKLNIYCNITLNCTSSISLTDANDVFANDYQLLQIKLGYTNQFKKIGIDVFAFLDNALNQLYSLGNDINSFGGRYFNPAPARNFQAGIKINF